MDIEKKFSHCGEYAIIKTLGSGFHAKVKMGSKNGQNVAIKIFKPEHSTQTNIKALANEINILKGLKHPNLVNLIDYCDSLPYKKKNGTTEPRVCMIMELAQGGELFEYIAQSGRFLPETSRFYFIQLLNALLYMKNQGVCHRDLKLENILLDEGYNMKVADFGFATLLARGRLTSHLGTPGYMAPEIVGKRDYDGTMADVFSAGVVLFILHAGSPPFSAASDKDPYFRLFLTNRQEQFWATHTKFKGGNPEFFPQEFRNLINGMLAPNPAQRFTLEQCINHPWLKGPTNTYEQVRAELSKRKEVVEREQEKEKIRLQAQKQQKKVQQPIGRFRSSTGEELDLTDIISKYNLEFDNRRIKTITPTGMLNEVFSLKAPDYMFCYLLKQAQKFDGTVNKIFDDRYKINFDIVQDEEKIAAIEVELQAVDGDEDKFRVNVKKLEGDYYKFHEINAQIKKLVEEVEVV